MTPLLSEHGTQIWTLKPASVVASSRRDLKLMQAKREVEPGRRGREQCVPYAFHRDHVRKADSAVQLLSEALLEQERGRASGKPQTRLIYADVELLAAALTLARGGTGEGSP